MSRLDASLTALSDGTRRALLARLARGPATVGELAAPFRISQQAVSKHLAMLERAALVAKTRRGREHVCRLTPEPLRDVAAWVDHFRSFWEGAFDELDALLHATHAPLPGAETTTPAPSASSRPPRTRAPARRAPRRSRP